MAVSPSHITHVTRCQMEHARGTAAVNSSCAACRNLVTLCAPRFHCALPRFALEIAGSDDSRTSRSEPSQDEGTTAFRASAENVSLALQPFSRLSAELLSADTAETSHALSDGVLACIYILLPESQLLCFTATLQSSHRLEESLKKSKSAWS